MLRVLLVSCSLLVGVVFLGTTAERLSVPVVRLDGTTTAILSEMSMMHFACSGFQPILLRCQIDVMIQWAP